MTPKQRDALAQLAHDILHLPPGFAWDFSALLFPSSCGTIGCALGCALYRKYGGDKAKAMILQPGFKMEDWACQEFGITLQECDALFVNLIPPPDGIGGDCYYNCLMPDVTPQMVAESITYLLTHGKLKDWRHEI